MNIRKLMLINLAGPALVTQISLAQMPTTHVHETSELARRVMAPLRLGPYATVPDLSRKPGPSAVELGLATAKTHKFASADYPGAGVTFVFDEKLSTILGDTEFTDTQGFTLNSSVSPVPQDSEANGINTSDQIVGSYRDVGSTLHGFSLQRRNSHQHRRSQCSGREHHTERPEETNTARLGTEATRVRL